MVIQGDGDERHDHVPRSDRDPGSQGKVGGCSKRRLADQVAGSHALSLADAWIAAAAIHCGATLLHKDPEFQAIDGLAQEWLA